MSKTSHHSRSAARWLVGAVSLLSLAGGRASAQTFLNTYVDADSLQASSVRQLGDGSLVLCGTGQRDFGPTMGIVLRTTATGQVLWGSKLEDQGNERLLDVRETSDGQIVAVGSSEFAPWVVALDRETGDVLWQRRSQQDGDLFSVAVVDGGLAVAGITLLGDLLVSRYDNAGALQWEAHYGWPDSNEVAHSIHARPGGGWLVGGNTTQFEQFGAANLWLLALDDSGQVEWANSFGDPDATEGILSRMDIAPSGAAYMVGTFNFSSPFEDDALVARLAPNGDLEWIRSLDLAFDESRAVAATADDGCVVLSQTHELGTNDDLWLARLDAQGDRQWERVIADFDLSVGSVATTRHGGLLLATAVSENFSFHEAQLTRLEAEGLAAVPCSTISDVFSQTSVEEVPEFRTLPPSSVEAGSDQPASPLRSAFLPGVESRCVGCNVNMRTYGQGLAGSGGFVPDLTGTEGPCDGSGQRLLHIEHGLGGARTILLIGLDRATLPAFGGDILVDLSRPWFTLRFRLSGDGNAGSGSWTYHSTTDLSGFLGLQIDYQALIVDPAAPRNFAMTNGLEWIVGN